ncbi:hypothetical protein [Micromonospora halophytica]|uniref:Uncharacterized protein n=1 Tax=Micromonospora halophytica TaxID=47864 RepID=A0A1C5HFQ0_9ACTN|nr:hypothetical protein [Micromonospora halophytica]SCG44825.1 hypothetical protein GA0070560_104105 [Micromonospora halophytica]
MSETLAVPSSPPTDRPGRRLLRHLIGMTVAMVAGMVLLDPLWRTAGTLLDFSALLARPEVAALVMATDMSIGMAVWMWHRGHPARATAEMVAAMYLPYLLLLVPFVTGLLDGDALLLGGHLLMVPAMVVVAVRHRHAHPAPPPRHRVVAALVDRWPTWLALLMTVDNWFAPVLLPPVSLLVLPLGFLVAGTVRRSWRDRGAVASQLAGLLGWSALATLAVVADDGPARWLVAGGWLAHAAWDAVHHRRDRVAPRGYTEFCGVLDVAVGLTMVVAILA